MDTNTDITQQHDNSFIKKKIIWKTLCKKCSICFDGKHCIKIVFRVFQCLVTLEKMS